MTTPTITLQAFERYVRPHARNAPDPLISQNLRLAAIEFSERARAWRHISTVTISRQHQAIVAPSYASIYEIETATFDGETDLIPTQYTDFEQAEFSEDAPPVYITQIAPDTVSLIPFQEGTLTVSLFLRPRHDTEFELNDQGLPEDVYDVVPQYYLTQHAEAIAHGALGRLLATPDTPFTDTDRAMYYARLFEQACDRHFTSNVEGQQNAPMRAVPDWM